MLIADQWCMPTTMVLDAQLLPEFIARTQDFSTRTNIPMADNCWDQLSQNPNDISTLLSWQKKMLAFVYTGILPNPTLFRAPVEDAPV